MQHMKGSLSKMPSIFGSGSGHSSAVTDKEESNKDPLRSRAFSLKIENMGQMFKTGENADDDNAGTSNI